MKRKSRSCCFSYMDGAIPPRAPFRCVRGERGWWGEQFGDRLIGDLSMQFAGTLPSRRPVQATVDTTDTPPVPPRSASTYAFPTLCAASLSRIQYRERKPCQGPSWDCACP